MDKNNDLQDANDSLNYLKLQLEHAILDHKDEDMTPVSDCINLIDKINEFILDAINFDK